MDVYARARGGCALLLVPGIGVGLAGGCGNTVAELIPASSAITVVDSGGHSGDSHATPGYSDPPDPVSHTAGNAKRVIAHTHSGPAVEAATNQRKDAGFCGETQSSGDPAGALDTTRTRTALPPSRPGPYLSRPAGSTNTCPAKERGK